MSGRKLVYLVIVISLMVLTVFVTGCTQEKKAGDEQAKQDEDEPNEYKVEVQANPEEAGEITGEGTYEEGEKVELEAVSKEGYEFKKWHLEGEDISEDKKYNFTMEKDKKFQAVFETEYNSDKFEQITTETDDGTIKETIMGANLIDELDPVKSNALTDEPIYIGENYIAQPDEEKGDLVIYQKDNLEHFDTVEGIVTKEGTNEKCVIIEDQLIYIPNTGQRAYFYSLEEEQASKEKKLNIQDLEWDIPEGLEKDGRGKFFINIHNNLHFQTSVIGNHLFLYADHSWVVRHEKPPRVEKPFLKVFELSEDGFKQKEINFEEEFEESPLITDIAIYDDNSAIIASGDKGFSLIDLNNFSIEHLEVGGTSHEGEVPGEGDSNFVSHKILGVNEYGILLTKSEVPIHACSARSIEIWAPDSNNSLDLTASTVQHLPGGFEEEKDDVMLVGAIPDEKGIKNNLWPTNMTESEQIEEGKRKSSLQISAFVSLDNNKVMKDVGENNSKLSEYLHKELDFAQTLDNGEIDQLPVIVKDTDKDHLHHTFDDPRPPIEAPVFASTNLNANSLDIELVYLKDNIKLIQIDPEDQDIYLKKDDSVYQIEYDSLFSH
ncbi:InlB B-repeat-containing protein [Natranaerobius thermophilus]|uniref:Bacterial repeat domain-containing protein n=1 Tax=Natranaerobius thermophilus (strain ATCC BAA-1301 / DSM 18059 / JW/NM-WN-LF) TaxID=457570 RepID=B2A105_NATTJ|nr:hypothetical protein [Natranaerobius thermophilus]ACB84628.1 hypothetical protein Nther_1044 [Natranaerobius thermophilus JW/NM-WN-LF]